MGVAGQLQVEARVGRSRCAARLVRQQQPHRGTGRRSVQREPRVAAVARVEMVRAVVGDTGHDHLTAAVAQNYVLVQQHCARPCAPPAGLGFPFSSFEYGICATSFAA